MLERHGGLVVVADAILPLWFLASGDPRLADEDPLALIRKRAVRCRAALRLRSRCIRRPEERMQGARGRRAEPSSTTPQGTPARFPAPRRPHLGRLRGHLIVWGSRTTPHPEDGGGPSSLAASRGVTSLRLRRPGGRWSSGRMVDHCACAALRRTCGPCLWRGRRPVRRPRRATMRRAAPPSRPLAYSPDGRRGLRG